EVTGGASQHGARTCYTYDTSYAIPAETSTIARFPSGWAAVYNSSYAPAVISPWWGIRDGYADSGPEAPALLTGKDVYKWDGTQYVLTERDIYGYGTLSRRQALVDYRASQIMKRILPGNIQYEDIYHYPVWANDYAGVTPSSVRHITCHSEGNDTTLVSYSYASRSSLSVPIRVSRKTVETGGVKRCVDYTYPDTWGVGRPTWAAQLTARHSLAGSVKENYGRLVPREFPIHHLHDSTRDSSSENTRIIQPVTFEPWLEVVTEHAPFMVNGVSRWLPSRLTESVDGVLSWSEEVLARDCMGNPTSMKEKGKPLTSVVWGYNGLFPVVIAQNASLADVITGLGGQTAADAITTASLVSSLQLSALDALRTSLQQAHVHTYAYAPGLGLLNQTDPAGIKTSYDRDGAGRLTAQRDADGNAIKAYIYSLLNSNGHRSIKSRTYQTADGGTFAEDIRWWNTLGLLQEDIAMGASGSGGADLVTAYEGDYLLHDDVKTWLPYPASGTSGAFQSNAPAAAANYHNSSLAFSYKGYEDSVRNRVERNALPGYAGAHEAQSQLAVNMAWPKLDWDDTQGIVTDGVVSVLEERETDADGRRVSTFRDGEGRVLGSSRGAATPTSTDSAPVYYVYDKHDRLRAVAGSGIALTDTLNMWRYGYDALSRLSSKGVPGLMRETYTYDSEDRLTTIIRSDGLRQMDYDAFGRVLTVTFTPTGETTPVLMESHSYDSEPASSVSIIIACGEPSSWAGAKNGLETYRQLALLDEDGTVTGYAATAIRYDEKGRVVCTATAWPDGTYTKEKNTYNFPGEVTATVVTCIRGTESDTLSISNTYDIRGRLTKTVSTLTGDAVATTLSDTTRFQHDALGRLQKCISRAGGTAISHASSISYNLQGLQNTQSMLIGSDSLYVERLAYDNPSAITGLSGINPSYSGYLTGITEVWPGITSQSEGYSYSTSGRLTCVHHPGNSEQ
ncbi:MAG: RHS repeat protein, partial [Bacteroidales bacterium]|nr:RHS repeat protein [Bacteroidales bacterium]